MTCADPCHPAIVTLDRDVTAEEHCSVGPEVGTPLFNQKCGPHNLLLRFKGFEAHRKPCKVKEMKDMAEEKRGKCCHLHVCLSPCMYKDAPDGWKGEVNVRSL